MKATIYLKSGASFTIDVDDLETARSPQSGELTRLTWVTSDNAVNELHTVKPSSVDAVVIHRERAPG